MELYIQLYLDYFKSLNSLEYLWWHVRCRTSDHIYLQDTFINHAGKRSNISDTEAWSLFQRLSLWFLIHFSKQITINKVLTSLHLIRSTIYTGDELRVLWIVRLLFCNHQNSVCQSTNTQTTFSKDVNYKYNQNTWTGRQVYYTLDSQPVNMLNMLQHGLGGSPSSFQMNAR